MDRSLRAVVDARVDSLICVSTSQDHRARAVERVAGKHLSPWRHSSGCMLNSPLLRRRSHLRVRFDWRSTMILRRMLLFPGMPFYVARGLHVVIQTLAPEVI